MALGKQILLGARIRAIFGIRTCDAQNAGFRPALEPLVSEFSKALLGSNIKVFGPGGETFEGQLNEYDDYDFMFVSKSEINFNWTIRQAGKIVVSKDDIIGIKKIQL